MYYNNLKNLKYEETINKENIKISEFTDNNKCFFKSEIKYSNNKTILENLQNKEQQIKKNPMLLEIVIKDNYYFYHFKSPAPLLGLPEQNIVFEVKIEDKCIFLTSIEQENIFEDTERNYINYFKMEEIDDYIQIFSVLEPSSILPGNNHMKILRNLLYFFFKSIC